MTLEDWHRFQWLNKKDTTVTEISQLMAVAERGLQDSKIEALSVDGRFQHAYDAALQCCMIALRAEGYSVRKGSGHHKHGIGSLPLSLGDEWKATSDHIERCSRLRGQSVYERTGVVSERDVVDLIETVERLYSHIREWLERAHPELINQSKGEHE
jgi:hypothetical protein